jgi:hypothetical protein
MQNAPQPDEFVDRVVSDPANPPRVAVVEGFVGRSSLEGHVRVYANPALTAWVDVPQDAIRHAQRLDDSALGGSILWVDAEAKLAPGSAEGDAERSAADFLRGPLRSRMTTRSEGDAGVSAATDEGRLSTYYPDCPPSIWPACGVA